GRDAGDPGVHGAGAGVDWRFVPVLLPERVAGDWRGDFRGCDGVPVFAEIGGAIFPAGGVCGAVAGDGVRRAAVCVDDVWDGGAACGSKDEVKEAKEGKEVKEIKKRRMELAPGCRVRGKELGRVVFL